MNEEPRSITNPPAQDNDDEIWLVQVAILGRDGEEMRFAIHTSHLVEVVELGVVEPLPPSCLPFVGVGDLRGMPVPILDLQLCIVGAPYAPVPGHPPRVLIWNDGARWIGVLVARTFQNRSYARADIVPTPTAIAGAHAGAIESLLRVRGGYVSVLDVSRLIAVRAPNADGLSTDQRREKADAM